MRYLIRALLCMLLLPSLSYAYSEEQVECLTVNIYHEARGENLQGQIAVAYVTLNRVHSERFPDTICEVVYQARYSKWWWDNHQRKVPVKNRCQFSWYCDGRSDKIADWKAYARANAVAHAVLSNIYEDTTGGALFYHTHQVNPYWSEHLQISAVIGNHLFYRHR